MPRVTEAALEAGTAEELVGETVAEQQAGMEEAQAEAMLEGYPAEMPVVFLVEMPEEFQPATPVV